MAIDELDGRLIVLLAREPRIGVLEASRRLGVARGTVQARLDRLQSHGVIRGFGPEVDPAALGYPVTAFATLEIKQGQGHGRPGASGAVPEVLELHTTTGHGRHALPTGGQVQRRPSAGDRPGGGLRRHRPRLHGDRHGEPGAAADHPAGGAGEPRSSPLTPRPQTRPVRPVRPALRTMCGLPEVSSSAPGRPSSVPAAPRPRPSAS